MSASNAEIVGREAELAVLAAFLDDARPLPAALVLEGEAGIGKTTLWQRGIDAAGGRRYRVLSCRPAAAEARLSFSALADLVEPVVAHALRPLTPPQRRALTAALLLEAPKGPAVDPRAVASAVLAALRVLARDTPLLVAVDDVQWVDSASAAALAFGLRRLADEPVALLLAHRTDEDRPVPLDLERTFPPERLERVRLGPLSLGALHHVLLARTGATLPRPILRRLHETSGGNPFFALEIARALGRREHAVSPGEPLPVPPTLQELVSERVGGLREEVRGPLATVAAAANPTVALVCAVGGESAVDALDEAADAGVLERHGDRVRFSHPLLASAVYGRLSTASRRALHRRLADALVDPEESAFHLALASDRADAKVARALDQAARRAYNRGAIDAAADLADEARRLTLSDRNGERARRSLQAAAYRFEAGDAAGARVLLEEVAASARGSELAEALARLARVHLFSGEIATAAAFFRRALDAPEVSTATRVEAEDGLVFSLLLVREDLHEAARHARVAVELAEALGDEAVIAEVAGTQAMVEAMLGHTDRADTALERALALEPATQHLRVLRHPSFGAGNVAIWRDDLAGAQARFEELERRAMAHGEEGALPTIFRYLSFVAYRTGRWGDAERLAGRAHEAALQSGQTQGQALLLYNRALLDAQLGRVERAAEWTDGTGSSEELFRRLTLGVLELSRGNAADAHRQLGPLVERMLEAGVGEPGAMRFLPDDVEALISLGRLEEAGALLAEFEGRARKLDRASALAAAARCRALLAAADGDLDGALAACDEALAQHERVAMPFERARSLLASGSIARRAKQKRVARDSFEQALAIFETLGAALWAEKTRGEIARIGGRARAARTGTLTATELRVASLVAEGRTNREVANELFVSVHTVEANLSKIYVKLGVRSRVELAQRLSKE